jgi:leucyl/phenylalanyl-tRNA---protein transferase
LPVFSLTRDYHEMPDARLATRSGLIAVSLDIHPERIIAAYHAGLFPWFQNYDGLFHWYSPNPRSVVYVDQLKVHKSMRSVFNQNKFKYTFDTAFLQVMDACRSTRRAYETDDSSSWLNSNFIKSYNKLHEMGICHSVEVWDEHNELVGGLYGIALGRIFFGESMFSKVNNASKAGFITLVRALQKHGFTLVDCQQDSPHLRTLGSTPISVDKYISHLKENRYQEQCTGHWHYHETAGELEILPLEAMAQERGVSGE